MNEIDEKISLQAFLDRIRTMKPDEKFGYATEITIKVCVNVHIGTDEQGNIEEFTPYINFNESDEYTTIGEIIWDVGKPQGTRDDCADLLQGFGEDVGMDLNAPIWEKELC